MKTVTLIDEELVIWHGALGSIYPSAWSRVLMKHFGGKEFSWYIALTTVYPYWDAPSDPDSKRIIVSPDLERWHATRKSIVERWIKRAKHEEPSLQEVTISHDALKSLEREAGQRCKQASDRFRIRVMRMLAHQGMNFALISLDTSSTLIRGILDAHKASFPVIGPEELGQVGLEGLTWERLAQIADADAATSRFITRREIDGWPIVHPWEDPASELMEQFRKTYKFNPRYRDYHTKDAAASQQALERLVAVAGVDFGEDFRAWRKWFVRRNKRQWISLMKDRDL